MYLDSPQNGRRRRRRTLLLVSGKLQTMQVHQILSWFIHRASFVWFGSWFEIWFVLRLGSWFCLVVGLGSGLVWRLVWSLVWFEVRFLVWSLVYGLVWFNIRFWLQYLRELLEGSSLAGVNRNVQSTWDSKYYDQVFFSWFEANLGTESLSSNIHISQNFHFLFIEHWARLWNTNFIFQFSHFYKSKIQIQTLLISLLPRSADNVWVNGTSTMCQVRFQTHIW